MPGGRIGSLSEMEVTNGTVAWSMPTNVNVIEPFLLGSFGNAYTSLRFVRLYFMLGGRICSLPGMQVTNGTSVGFCWKI